MRNRIALTLVAAACALAAVPARAGPYSDALGKCLVQATTRQDREALVRWMFVALAHHPAVRSLVKVSAAQGDAANKATAEMFMRLLTTSCRDDTQRAMQYEGAAAIQTGFQLLGQVAGMELMGSPDVAASLSGLQKHIDEKRLDAVLKPASAGR